MNISDYDYPLPDERIAKFPLAERDSSKLLVWDGGTRGKVAADESVSEGIISETVFGNIGDVLPHGSLLVFNDTRVVRARLVMNKPVTQTVGSTSGQARGTKGARIEVLCLEPVVPADYESAFAARRSCEWACMVGGLKKWRSGPLEIPFSYAGGEHKLLAWKGSSVRGQLSLDPSCTMYDDGASVGEPTLPGGMVRFEWDADITFGELLEHLGSMPIPPYLNRDSEAIDNTRYQTVYARNEGSVAAPTAGLHFTPELLDKLRRQDTKYTGSSIGQGGVTGAPLSLKIEFEEVTLHVGAGTFLPVKTADALDHPMHTEHFEITLPAIEHLIARTGSVIAVGTTSVRTLESLVVLGYRILQTGGAEEGSPDAERPIGQFEPYDIPPEYDGKTALETLAVYLRRHGMDRIAASTRIMITPEGFRFRIVNGIITNFHQPKSTLLLLVSAFTGGKEWRRIYDHALAHDFRFLSYGDSSLLLP